MNQAKSRAHGPGGGVRDSQDFGFPAAPARELVANRVTTKYL